MTDCLLYFVKYPEPGRVKTRLAADSSPELAAAFYAAMARETLERLAGCGVDILVCYAPASEAERMADWLGGEYLFMSQRGGDLGQRMENGFLDAFARGYDRVLLTGSDIPGLSPAIIREGLDAVRAGSAVLGPAEDGGYYAIGFHRDGFVPGVFHDMVWSTAHVYERTGAALSAAEKAVHRLPMLADVDTVVDAHRLLGLLGPRARRIAGELVNSSQK